MIPVAAAPEPKAFDAKVRQLGLSAIDEMVGRPPRVRRKGRKRSKIAMREQDIPADVFPPYWRQALPEMLTAYHRRCAYLAMHIHHATGSPTVDHVQPKSLSWDQIYEWDNYRLCAAIINSKKGALQTLVDPFKLGAGWFSLNVRTFHVERGAAAPQAEWARIDATLPVLNHALCVDEREEYAGCYWAGAHAGGFDLAHLEERAPFVASELQRQDFQLQVRPQHFVLSAQTHRLERAPHLPVAEHARIDIMLAALNRRLALTERAERVALYLRGSKANGYALADLEARDAFAASELRRQGLLVRGDS